jgi:iron complex transport system permease protein
LAAVLLLPAMLLAVSVGAAPIPPRAIVSSAAAGLGLPAQSVARWFGAGMDPTQSAILVGYRLPRVLVAALVGGVLALSGASYQGVFRNPLADPYLLGAAAGAGVGATVVIVYLPGAQFALPLAAFAGSLGGVLMAYTLGVGLTRGRSGSGTLLLAGVAVASFLTAVQTTIQQAHSESLARVYSWIMGQLGGTEFDQLGLVAPYLALAVAVLIGSAGRLDVLSVGDDEARALGAHPGRTRFVVLAAASLATACVVALSGLIGFVGLVVPHLVRRVAGGSYRVVLPMSLFCGASFLVLADLLARTVLAPTELPIGVVTAFLGAPFFAALLRVGDGS